MAKPLKLVVIFESNIIFGLPLSKEVRDFITATNADKRLKPTYYVPETVLEEAKKKFISDFKNSRLKYLNSTKIISSILKSKKFPDVLASDSSLEKRVEKAFTKYGIKILKTPNDKINWSEVRKSAVFQIPPFSPGDSEKGFKDALIAQTILFSLASFRSKQVAIISRDGLLSEFLKDKTKLKKNTTLYPSLPDFQSALRLQLLGSPLRSEIASEAKLAFYNPDDASLPPSERRSIFYKQDFPRQLIVKFPTLFANPKISQDSYGLATWHPEASLYWQPIAEPSFAVANPVFVNKSPSGEYYWESTVVYRQAFEHRAPVSGPYSGFNNRGELRLEFLVKWNSKVDEQGKIDSASAVIKDIIPQPQTDYSAWGLVDVPSGYGSVSPSASLSTRGSGATLAGQGTVPIVPVADVPLPSMATGPSGPTGSWQVGDPFDNLSVINEDPDKEK